MVGARRGGGLLPLARGRESPTVSTPPTQTCILVSKVALIETQAWICLLSMGRHLAMAAASQLGALAALILLCAPGGASGQALCDVGYYQASNGTCVLCNPGTYQPLPGQRSCELVGGVDGSAAVLLRGEAVRWCCEVGGRYAGGTTGCCCW